MAKQEWEEQLRKQLLELLTASFKDNNSLSEELKTYAIKNHLLDDITNFIQNEHRLFDQKIQVCKEKDLQRKIDEIVERKNYFYVGWMMTSVNYDLWQAKPSIDNCPKWRAYTSKHKHVEEKVQTFYAHVNENCEQKIASMVENNKEHMFCLNSGEESKTSNKGRAMTNGHSSTDTTTKKGIVYILEYSKISYNVLIAGDCLLNGIKARQLHDIHKTEVVVYPRATTGELFKNYTKAILRTSADVMILHFGTYDLTLGSQQETKQNMRCFLKKIKEKHPQMTIAVSSIVARVDKRGIRASVKSLNSQLKSLCAEEHIDFINNDNVSETHLSQKMLLTLTGEGKNVLARNMSKYINNLV